MTIELASYNLLDAEKIIIERLLLENPDTTVSEQAEMLGITRATLYNKLYNMGIKLNTHIRGRKKNGA